MNNLHFTRVDFKRVVRRGEHIVEVKYYLANTIYIYGSVKDPRKVFKHEFEDCTIQHLVRSLHHYWITDNDWMRYTIGKETELNFMGWNKDSLNL